VATLLERRWLPPCVLCDFSEQGTSSKCISGVEKLSYGYPNRLIRTFVDGSSSSNCETGRYAADRLRSWTASWHEDDHDRSRPKR